MVMQKWVQQDEIKESHIMIQQHLKCENNIGILEYTTHSWS